MTETYDERHHPRRRASDRRAAWWQLERGVRLGPVSTAIGLLVSLGGSVAAYYGGQAQSQVRDALHEHRISAVETTVQEIRAESKAWTSALGDIRVLSTQMQALSAQLERAEERERRRR